MTVSLDDPWRPASTEIYEIRIQGNLDRRWFDWFDPLQVVQIDPKSGETVLHGSIPDQAALHGVLARIRDLNLKLISVSIVPRGPVPDER